MAARKVRSDTTSKASITSSATEPSKRPKPSKCECTTHSHTFITALHSTQTATYSSVLDCHLYITPHSVLPCKVLLDTGALNSNSASLRVGNWLEQASLGLSGPAKGGIVSLDNASVSLSVVQQSICSPLLNTCVNVTKVFSPTIVLHTPHKDAPKAILKIDLKIVDGFDSPHYDMVVGLPTIKAHRLLSKFARQIEAHCSEREVAGPDQSDSYAQLELTAPSPNLQATASTLGCQVETTEHVPVTQNTLSSLDGEQDIPEEQPSLSWFEDEASSATDIPQQIFGSPDLRKKLTALCLEYKHIFRRTLAREPAKVPPLRLSVTEQEWTQPSNSGPPRLQSTLKEAEIQRQTAAMLDINVIRPSHAMHYSQVHLTPKPNGKWRYCIDFRGINKAGLATTKHTPNATTRWPCTTS